jgi:hypothetical protein
MFRTELTITPSSNKINHASRVLTIGSCFSQVIGERLSGHKFEALVNPFGTVFNPVSIVRLLENAAKNNFSSMDAPLMREGIWFNHHVHSDFYGNTKEELDTKLKDRLKNVHEVLSKADTLIITLGTAFVYRLKSNNEIVANCHKVPAANFSKQLLTVHEIVNSFAALLEQFKIQNSKFRILLTVSPVRHIKDTLPLNSVSKSTLRLACHELSEKFENVSYFPAYEIMMDDLRDYRFYKEDMIHPTEVAEEYIWNKFSDCYFNEETRKLVQDWSTVSKALQHRPFREDSEEHKKFLKNLLEKLKLLQDRIDVRSEIEFVSNKL